MPLVIFSWLLIALVVWLNLIIPNFGIIMGLIIAFVLHLLTGLLIWEQMKDDWRTRKDKGRWPYRR